MVSSVTFTAGGNLVVLRVDHMPAFQKRTRKLVTLSILTIIPGDKWEWQPMGRSTQQSRICWESLYWQTLSLFWSCDSLKLQDSRVLVPHHTLANGSVKEMDPDNLQRKFLSSLRGTSMKMEMAIERAWCSDFFVRTWLGVQASNSNSFVRNEEGPYTLDISHKKKEV